MHGYRCCRFPSKIANYCPFVSSTTKSTFSTPIPSRRRSTWPTATPTSSENVIADVISYFVCISAEKVAFVRRLRDHIAAYAQRSPDVECTRRVRGRVAHKRPALRGRHRLRLRRHALFRRVQAHPRREAVTSRHGRLQARPQGPQHHRGHQHHCRLLHLPAQV